jgi:AcrR family transcriptional regulator
MQHADETRKRLLKATLELISEKGYIGATTREIASRAGVSELTLFRKFGKKENLFEEMLQTYTFLPRLRGLIEEINEMPVEEGLNTIGIRFLQTLRERRALIQVLLSEITTYPRKVRSVHQQMIENMAKILENYLEERKGRKEVRNIDMDLTAFAFLRVLFMTYLNISILRGEEMSDERIEVTVGMLVDIFLNGVASKREV